MEYPFPSSYDQETNWKKETLSLVILAVTWRMMPSLVAGGPAFRVTQQQQRGAVPSAPPAKEATKIKAV